MNKIKKYSYLIVIVVIFSMLLMPDFLASGDVGNAFSGNVSSNSQSTDGSGLFYIIYYIMWIVPFPFNFLIIGLIIFGGMSANSKRIDHSNSRVVNKNMTIQFKDDEIVHTLKKRDINFSKYAFITYAKECLIAFQEAMENHRILDVSVFASNELKDVVKKMIDSDTNYFYQGQEILDVSFKSYHTDETYEYIHLELFVSEYYYEQLNGVDTYGSQYQRVNHVYDVLFKRSLMCTTNTSIKPSTTNCPSCGASNCINLRGECEYCNSLIVNGDYSFVMESVVLISEVQSIYYDKYHRGRLEVLNNEEVVVNQIKLLDPDFELIQFENFASNAMISIQEAWEHRDLKMIRRYESEDLYSIHTTQIQEFMDKDLYPIIDDQNIIDVHLNRFELDGSFEYLTVIIKCQVKVYVKDKSGKVITGNSKLDRKNGYRLRFKRGSGVKTTLVESINNCPNCGAKIDLTNTGECSYCQSQVTSGQHGWIVDSYDAINKV